MGKRDIHIQMKGTGSSHTIITSEWVKDLRSQTVKFLEENTGQKFYNTGRGNDFLDVIPKAQAKKKKKSKNRPGGTMAN